MEIFSPGASAQRDFRDALGRFATGVTVVTCQSEIGPLGITANSFSSLSLDPPLVLWAPARSSRRFPAFVNAEHFAIHILSDRQNDVSLAFSDSSDFAGLNWRMSADEVPLIADCLARFECQRHAVHDGGDHAIVVGLVTRAAVGTGDPLIFSGGNYGGFNHRKR